MDTSPIKLEHKTEIERLRQIYGHALSSHAFASLYLWQDEMQLSLHLQENFFSVKVGSRGENTWFFPCGEEEAVLRFLQERMGTPAFSLCYLRSCDVQWLSQRFLEQWEVRREEDSDEYICRIPDYLAMEGGKFSDVRKKIRHLERTYRTAVRPISEGTLQDAYNILHQWRQNSHHASSGNLRDLTVSETALSQRDILDVTGSILYLDDRPVAMFAGFPLDQETIDAAVGKCVPDAPGYTVYFAMREYLKQYQGRYLYCNLEEDLGIPGIRMVKQKMRPMGKHEIWEAVLR